VWKDKEGVLTIGKRKGHFEGMVETIDFTLQVMGKEQVSLKYTGKEMEYKI
jgi:hypothetical protein